MDIDSNIKYVSEAVIQKLIVDVRGIKAIVISTEDGFEIAAYIENADHISRLAAMASSLAALGAIAGQESQLGICDNILIGAENGYLLMLQAKHPTINVIISIITSQDAVIGQVLYFAKQASKSLEAA